MCVLVYLFVCLFAFPPHSATAEQSIYRTEKHFCNPTCRRAFVSFIITPSIGESMGILSGSISLTKLDGEVQIERGSKDVFY
jgi:hypothetical protein